MENLSLRPYQKSDVEFLASKKAAGCFNEQRTGKTPTALMTIKEKGLEDTKILIVTTSSAIYQWKDEYERWLNKPCEVVDGSPKNKIKAIDNWTHGLVISYGSLKHTSKNDGYVSFLLPKNPTMVIVDEAHQFRHTKTALFKSIKQLTKIPNKLALTGTPAYGRSTDIYAILNFLFPTVFSSEYGFYKKYFKEENKYIPLPGGNYRIVTEYNDFRPGMKEALQHTLSETCTQRKRTEVMQWLPKKDKQIIELPLTAPQTKYLKELSEKFETEDLTTKGVLDRLVRYRQICLDPKLLGLKGDSPKTQWIINFISENPEIPLIIFSNFTSYLKSLFSELKQKNVKEAMIIGEISPTKRAQFQNDFQKGKFNVFLINIAAGKEALTLDRAEAIIFSDVFPPIGSVEQAEDRFVATTEERASKPHTIYYLAMKESYDINIINLLNQRKTETEVINDFRSQLKIK